ncbi:hypothetical protein [Paenibacillus crassostreae]|nr:hypothetical protein [Paenibacillus crassostreae]
MKNKMVGLLIALIIVIGFTNPFVPVTGGQVTPLGDYGTGNF